MLLKGMDYFPLSTDFFEEDKIALIEAEFGEKGLVILLKFFAKYTKTGSTWNGMKISAYFLRGRP